MSASLYKFASHTKKPVIELPKLVFPVPHSWHQSGDWEVLVRFAYVFVIRGPETVWIFCCGHSAKDNFGPYAQTADEVRARRFELGAGSGGFSTLEYFADRVRGVSLRFKTAPFALYGGFRFPRIIPRYLRYTAEVLPRGIFEDGELEFRAESELDARSRESELDPRLCSPKTTIPL